VSEISVQQQIYPSDANLKLGFFSKKKEKKRRALIL
jgi:hypothetical protein